MFSSNSSQVSSAANYIENFFSTYLYTGNASSQTIANNIDVSSKGGLVWIKNRSTTASHYLFDTARGSDYTLDTNSTSSQGSGWSASGFFNPGFLTNGFGIGSDSTLNGSGSTYASWTFRKQPKFFDVVTYTGNGANRTIAHNLGSVPGCIIIKRTDSADNWIVYHRSLGNDYELFLDLTYAKNYTNDFNFTDPTSTTFAVNGNPAVNASGGTYVAYLFAHNAGGFGLTGTDNVISCGSFTVDGSGNCSVSLGYEPQWLLVKSSTATDNWYLYDNMRGFPAPSGTGELLRPNTSQAGIAASTFYPSSTGFTGSPGTGFGTGIYIAIRRGPMAVPTTGTSVYNGIATTGTGTDSRVITGYGFPPDLLLFGPRSQGGYDRRIFDRLRNTLLYTDTTSSEASIGPYAISTINQSQDGYTQGTSDSGAYNQSGTTWINWGFRRAPSVFDVVCYTGTGTTPQNVYHNLGVVPELIMFKSRSTAGNWQVFSQMTVSGLNRSYLNFNNAASAYLWTDGIGLSSQPTSTLMAMDNSSANIHTSGVTYVAYLFATCPGVSKVGSYTGNGSTQAIACGFTGGARFVLIKRTDDVGDWYVYDTARGMSTLTDPYILLDSTAAETATLGSVTTTTGGFTVNASILSAINTNAASYIFIAIS